MIKGFIEWSREGFALLNKIKRGSHSIGMKLDHPKPVAKLRGDMSSGPSRNFDKTTIGLSTTCLPAAPTKKAVVKVRVCILQAYHKVFTSHPDSPNRLRKHVFPQSELTLTLHQKRVDVWSKVMTVIPV